MISQLEVVERLPFLPESDPFFCISYFWWEGAGVDAVAWWLENGISHRRVLKTGEVSSYTIPKVISDVQGDMAAFYSVMSQASEDGFFDLSSQTKSTVLNNYDLWIGYRKDYLGPARWIGIKSGICTDERVNSVLKKIRNYSPELFS
jgi:hypothetical protein